MAAILSRPQCVDIMQTEYHRQGVLHFQNVCYFKMPNMLKPLGFLINQYLLIVVHFLLTSIHTT